MGQTTVKTAELNGITMRYAVFGQGLRPMVILPGLSLIEVTDSADAVAAAYKCFTKDFTVYLFDRRLNPPMNYTLRQMASDTATVMRSLGIQNACIFGASQGGMIAQFLAIDAPELAAGLALASTFYEETEIMRGVMDHWLQLAEHGEGPELIRDCVERIYSEETRRLYGEAIIASYGKLSRKELDRFSLCIRASFEQRTTELLSEIRCPVLVIAAEGDRITLADNSRRLAEMLHAECLIYDDSYGHAVYDEAPDVKEKLMAFFRTAVNL